MTDRPEKVDLTRIANTLELSEQMKTYPLETAHGQVFEAAKRYMTLAKALEAGEVRIVPTSPDYEMIYQMQIEGCPYPVQTYEAAIKAAPEWEWGGG